MMRMFALVALATMALAGSASAAGKPINGWLTLKDSTTRNHVIFDGVVWQCKVDVCRAARTKACPDGCEQCVVTAASPARKNPGVSRPSASCLPSRFSIIRPRRAAGSRPTRPTKTWSACLERGCRIGRSIGSESASG